MKNQDSGSFNFRNGIQKNNFFSFMIMSLCVMEQCLDYESYCAFCEN